MDRQPTLEGEQLLLRPLREADRAALYAAANDPALWADHPDPERWRAEVFWPYFADLLARGGALAVIDKASGALIGTSSYQYGSPDDGGTIEIGSTFLARSHWGGGTNRAMKRLLIAHALGAVQTVEFWAGQGNLRSRRALEKIGAVLNDRIELVEIAGQTVPHLVFAVTRESFAAGPLVG